MEFLIIFIVLLIIGIIIFNAILPKVKKQNLLKRLDEHIQKDKSNYKLTINKSDIFDATLDINMQQFIIKVLIVPNYSEIQINNKSTWELKYGAGNTPGKVQPHKRYLTEIVDFQNTDFDNKIKVVIISPKPKKIVKYVNECEIVIVNSKTDVYGTRIITDRQFAFFIKNVE